MYALLQQQQQRRRQQEQQEREEQQEQQPSPYWHPQPAVPPITATPTFHNNSALAAHSPMARYQSSLHAHAHAEALNRHPWNTHPPATPAPSLPLHRQPAPSPAIVRLLTAFLCIMFAYSQFFFSHSMPILRVPGVLPHFHFCPSERQTRSCKRMLRQLPAYWFP